MLSRCAVSARVHGIVAVLALWPAEASAQQSPLPPSEWTPEAQLWLARALVAEAGWSREGDHAAIAWVLYRRWERVAPATGISFVAMVRAYCAGLRTYGAVTERQAWIRTLRWRAPEGRLARYDKDWARIRAFTLAWGRGEVADPCAGQAIHWGGIGDHAPAHWRNVDCGQTVNRFYALR